MLQNYKTYTNPELERWLHLRAIEWSGWVTFVSLPTIPVLLVFFQWYTVLIGLLFVNLAWQFIQHLFVSVCLSAISNLAVVWLQWPAALGCSIYLFTQGKFGVGVLAFLWPIIGCYVTSPVDALLSRLGLRRSIGSIEFSLARLRGYIGTESEMVSSTCALTMDTRSACP